MTRTPAWPPAPPEPAGRARRRRPEQLPPAMVTLAGVCGMIGLVPSAFLGLVALPWFFLFVIGAFQLPFSHGGSADEIIRMVPIIQGLLLAAGFPVLLLLGVLRLFGRRGRWLLIVACLPATGLAAWLLWDQVAGGGESGWLALVVLGPALAPPFALSPSVRRWLDSRPAPDLP